MSRSLHARETSDANSGVSILGRAEPCSNSFVNVSSGPRGSSSRRVPVLGKNRDSCKRSSKPVLPHSNAEAARVLDVSVDFLYWVDRFLHLSGSARSGLASFIRLSLAPSACTAQPAARGVGDVWPVPPPCRWTAHSHGKLNSRRRRRQSARFCVARLAALIGFLLVALLYLPRMHVLAVPF